MAKKTRKEINKLVNGKRKEQLEFFNGKYNGWWYYQFFASMFNNNSTRTRR